jgi:hypothetical protein
MLPLTITLATNMKKCFKCGEVKEISNFHKHSEMKDGFLNKCKSCVVEDVKNWRKLNPDARKREHAKNREKKGFLTKEQWKIKVAKNAIGKKASALKYSHKRKTQMQTILESQFTEFVLEEAFILSELREKLTGIKWNLDHIVPLNHKDACGLHYYLNFQVVPARWNFRKSNKNMNFWINNAYAGY